MANKMSDETLIAHSKCPTCSKKLDVRIARLANLFIEKNVYKTALEALKNAIRIYRS